MRPRRVRQGRGTPGPVGGSAWALIGLVVLIVACDDSALQAKDEAAAASAARQPPGDAGDGAVAIGVDGGPADPLALRKPAPVTALVGATVIDGAGGPPLAQAVVILDEGRIKTVGPFAEVAIPAGAKTVDVTGKWIVPGLVDSHIHFFQSAGLFTRPDIIDLRAVRPYADEQAHINRTLGQTFRRYLASGVTAVVDMGGPFWNFEVREQARASLLAPRVAVAGPLVATVARPQLDVGDPPIIEATDPAAARALVREQLARQPDLIKIWYIVLPGRDPAELEGILQAAVDEAHRGKVRVAVHATELESARAAVRAGAEVLVHSIHDHPVDAELLGLMKKQGTLFIATLAVMEGYADVLGGAVRLSAVEEQYGDPDAITSWSQLGALKPDTPRKVIEQRRRKLRARLPVMADNLVRVHQAGITVAAGTDAGNVGTLHGASLHREFELMVEAGMSEAEVLVAATRNAALVFSPKPSFGTVQPEMLADLLVLDADPLVDIQNLRRIAMVIKGGVLLERDEILPVNPEVVVQRQVEAYNDRDLPRFLSLYADDVQVIRQPSGEVVAKDKAAMRPIYDKLFRSSPELHCRVLRRMVLGSTVVDEELVTGIRDRPYVRGIARYEIQGGLIRRVSLETRR